MSENKILRTALADWLADATSSHLEAEEIVAYAEGSLDGEETDRVREHLVACAACNRLFLDYAALVDATLGTSPPPSEHEVALAWRRFSKRLDGSSRDAARRSPTLWQLSLAACLAALVGLSLWAAHLSQALRTPRLNTPVYDLSTASVRAAQDVPVIEIGEQPFVTLVVNTPWQPEDTTYNASLLRDGEVIWAGDGWARNNFGSLSLLLPRALVESGEYRLRLERPDGELVAEVPLRIVLTGR